MYKSFDDAMDVARFLAKNNRASSVSVEKRGDVFEVVYKDLSNDYPWIRG